MNDWKGDVRVNITAKVPKKRKNALCYFVLFWIMFRRTHHFSTIAKVSCILSVCSLELDNAHPDHAGSPWRPPTHSEKAEVFETLCNEK